MRCDGSPVPSSVASIACVDRPSSGLWPCSVRILRNLARGALLSGALSTLSSRSASLSATLLAALTSSSHQTTESYFYLVVEEVLDAINAHVGNFGLTEETIQKEDYLRALAEDMKAYWGDALEGVVGAFDGWACAIKRPHDADYQPYRNRKGFFAYVVQVCVDAQRRFIHMRCKEKGATNDSLVFRTSAIGQAILAGKVPWPFVFVGDAAYPLHRSMMVPYGGKSRDEWKDSFDFWQSHYRMNVECALGALQRRFGIFWRPLEVHQSKVWLIISACMRLHNWLIDIKDTVLSTAFEKDMPSRPECIPITMQSDGAADEAEEAEHNRERMGQTREQVRDNMTRRLRENALRRPGAPAGKRAWSS